jgi:hypothetical protein
LSETDLQRSILKALEQSGYWAFRVNSGLRGSGKVQLAPAGTPDICCVSPPGWIEVKLPGEGPNDAQRDWHARARRLGIRVEIVDSMRDALAIVGRWAQQDASRTGLMFQLRQLAAEAL